VKLFVLASAIPFKRHDQPGVTAVNIVLFELLRGLLEVGHQLTFQIIFNEFRSNPDLTVAEQQEIHGLSNMGVRILPQLGKTDYFVYESTSTPWKKMQRLARFLSGQANMRAFYPTIQARYIIEKRVDEVNPDAILSVWSPEGLAATHGLSRRPRIAYQGDVDFAPAESRLSDRMLFPATTKQDGHGTAVKTLLHYMRTRYELMEFKRAHFTLMSQVDLITNVTASNAEIYRRCSRHQRSIYIRNTWSDPGIPNMSLGDWNDREKNGRQPIKIIGHVGYLNSTGSIYGLKFLLVDLMPYLEKVMGGLDYQIHIIGGGEITPSLRPYLRHDRIVLRGYVQDLDQELRSCRVLLLLNNAGTYQAAYTRHLVAWAMGLCLVVHANSKRAIPEINHAENALAGTTPDEVARMIFLAVSNPELNARVRKGGRTTYEQYFTPLVVVETLSKEIEGVVNGAGAK